jgi:hypothetical protein
VLHLLARKLKKSRQTLGTYRFTPYTATRKSNSPTTRAPLHNAIDLKKTPQTVAQESVPRIFSGGSKFGRCLQLCCHFFAEVF